MAKRARKWGTQDEVAHAFASGEAGPWMASKGSFFWEEGADSSKRTLYSYGCHFPLVVKVPGQPFILNGDEYSVTTRQHQEITQSAIRGSRITTSFSALREALGRSVEGELYRGNLIVVDATEEMHLSYTPEDQPDEIPPGATAFRRTNAVTGEEYIFLVHRPSTVVFLQTSGTGGETGRYLLAGMDERSYFISELPHPVETVQEAFNSLQPLEVAVGLDKGLLSPSDVVRQGEWFFFDLKVDPKECRKVYHKYMEKEFILPRSSSSSNPHTATRGCHPMDVNLGEEADRLIKMGLDAHTIVVSGQVRHPEHRMARLSTTKDIKLFAAVKNMSVADWSAGGRVD